MLIQVINHYLVDHDIMKYLEAYNYKDYLIENICIVN